MSLSRARKPEIKAIDRPKPPEFRAYATTESMGQLYQEVIRDAASMIPVTWDGATILDVACGQVQYVVDHLWQRARARIGADLSYDAVAVNKGVMPACADMYALPFRGASFDIVVSVDTIEHAATPQRFLEEVSRVLRPGGSMVTITPNLAGYHAMIAKLIGNRGAELVWRVLKGRSLPYDLYYRANTIRRLKKLGSVAGLQVEHVVYVPCVQHFFWPSTQLSRFFMRYHHAVTRLGMPWLLPTMIVHLRKR